MEINNPQAFDHIIGINGEILQPKVSTYGDLELAKVQPEPIMWRKTTADEYHLLPAVIGMNGGVLHPIIQASDAVEEEKISNYTIIWRNVEIDSLYAPPAIVSSNGIILRTEILDIGVWNMDLTDTVNVAHGLTADNIRTVHAIIIGDDGVSYYPIATGYGAIASDLQGWVSGWDTTNIMLYRKGTGMFDSDIFNDGVMNRGYVTVWYAI